MAFLNTRPLVAFLLIAGAASAASAQRTPRDSAAADSARRAARLAPVVTT
ncbi:MAG: hypothetical protein JWN79_1757, partial [Gemmatimonadetes bacterium]|nr:hypothetical protein [Gemmatimonadota bacterium]